MNEKELLELASQSVDVSEALLKVDKENTPTFNTILAFVRTNKIQDGPDPVPLNVLYVLFKECTDTDIKYPQFSHVMAKLLTPVHKERGESFYNVDKDLIRNLNERHYEDAKILQNSDTYRQQVQDKLQGEEKKSFDRLVEEYKRIRQEKAESQAATAIPKEVYIQNNKDPYPQNSSNAVVFWPSKEKKKKRLK